MYLKSTVQLEASSWLIDNFNGRWHAQPIKGQFWRESRRWMKWVTSHMEAWSSLRSSKSSNHHGRPMIGTALTSKWKASTRMSQCIERIKKALNNKQRHPVMMEHWRGGTYISNQVRMHTCHLTSKHCIYFWFVAGKILNVVQQDWGQRKNCWFEEQQRIMVLTLEWEEDEINPNIREISKK